MKFNFYYLSHKPRKFFNFYPPPIQTFSLLPFTPLATISSVKNGVSVMFGSWNPSQYLLQTASGLVKLAKGFCALQGILCATSSSAVVQVWDTTGTDATPGAVQITGSLSLTAGQSYPIPSKINYGLYVKLVSGSGSWTTFFD